MRNIRSAALPVRLVNNFKTTLTVGATSIPPQGCALFYPADFDTPIVTNTNDTNVPISQIVQNATAYYKDPTGPKTYMNYLLPVAYSNNQCPSGDGNIITIVYRGTGDYSPPPVFNNNTLATVSLYDSSSSLIVTVPANSASPFDGSRNLSCSNIEGFLNIKCPFITFTTLPGEMFAIGQSVYCNVIESLPLYVSRCPPINNIPLMPINGPIDLTYSWLAMGPGNKITQPMFVYPTNFTGPVTTGSGVRLIPQEDGRTIALSYTFSNGDVLAAYWTSEGSAAIDAIYKSAPNVTKIQYVWNSNFNSVCYLTGYFGGFPNGPSTRVANYFEFYFDFVSPTQVSAAYVNFIPQIGPVMPYGAVSARAARPMAGSIPAPSSALAVTAETFSSPTVVHHYHHHYHHFT